MYVFNNNKYSDNNPSNYDTTIKNYNGFIVLELGFLPIKSKKEKINYTKINPSHINVKGVPKELLEYHYGIYRMFPCGFQHNYHMRFIHVKGVTERRIRS